MTITNLLDSGKLTREGALRLIESLLEGETQIDVRTGEINICYGSNPQSYASYESVTGYDTIDDFANEFNNGWRTMEGKQPYNNFLIVAEMIGLELE